MADLTPESTAAAVIQVTAEQVDATRVSPDAGVPQAFRDALGSADPERALLGAAKALLRREADRETLLGSLNQLFDEANARGDDAGEDLIMDVIDLLYRCTPTPLSEPSRGVTPDERLCLRSLRRGRLGHVDGDGVPQTFRDALGATDPERALLDAVKALFRRELDREALLGSLDRLRDEAGARGDDAGEDLIMDVMDLLYGWCAPAYKLAPSDPSSTSANPPGGDAR